jgi:hypothetical protein
MANPAKTKKQLGYFKFGSVLFSTTLSLFIVGLFGIILIQASSLTKMIRENIEIQVFLDKELSSEQLAQIRKNLAERPFVLAKEDSGPDFENNAVYKWMKKRMNLSTEYRGHDFWFRDKGVRYFTPLFVALVVMAVVTSIMAGPMLQYFLTGEMKVATSIKEIIPFIDEEKAAE